MKSILGLLVLALAAGAVDQKSAPAGKAQGSPAAPITIEVFSDFQCPSCKNLYEETLKPLIAGYVSKGKAYMIHRDFPLAMHPYARAAATYANASLRVNKYEQVCAALFRNQATWAANGKIEDALATVLAPAEMQKVRALVKDPKLNAEIEQDVALGNQAKIRQTPTMIVTSKGRVYPIPGSVKYEILSKFLDDLLAAK
jgi:protein-disulfide isomerase